MKIVEIKNNKILLRPSANYALPLLYASIFLVLAFAVSIISHGIESFEFWREGIFFLGTCFLLFCILCFGFSPIIIDFDKERIYSVHFFISYKLVDFMDIKDISLQDSGGTYRGCFFLTKKSDPYGKNIRLTSKDMNEVFAETVFPILDNYISLYSEEVKLPVVTKYQLYKISGSKYIPKTRFFRNNLALLVLPIFLVILILLSVDRNFGDTKVNFFLLSYFVLCVIFTYIAVKPKIFFDISIKKIVVPRGFRRKQYLPFESFVDFNIERKTVNGLYDGTDIYGAFIQDNAEIRILLYENIKKNNIDTFLAETLSLMNQERSHSESD